MARSSYGEGQAGDLDFAGFAQEFLRRNSAYIREYRAIRPATKAAKSSSDQEEMARNWGLTFPL